MLPTRQSYFLLSLPVQHGESRPPVGRQRGAPVQKILLSLSLPVQHSKSGYLVGRRRGAPGQTIFLSLSLPVQQSKSWYLVGRRRGAPGQTNLTFPVFTCPTQQVLISCWTPARCSRPDKRSSVCSHQKYRTPSNATYPAVLASLAFSPPPARFHHPAQVSISPQMQQEPPGWTTSPFPPSSAKLTHQTGGHAHQLDVG